MTINVNRCISAKSVRACLPDAKPEVHDELEIENVFSQGDYAPPLLRQQEFPGASITVLAPCSSWFTGESEAAHRLFGFSRALAAVAISVWGASAQTAQITGTIADPSGAVVVGATVVASNVATGVVTNSTANSSGDYVVASLIPGTYSITASAPGFKKVVWDAVKLEVDQVARLDFNLEIGSSTETVSVSAQAILLDAETSALSTVVQNEQITELPLNGRDPIDLVALSPGIRIQGGFGGPGGPGITFLQTEDWQMPTAF